MTQQETTTFQLKQMNRKTNKKYAQNVEFFLMSHYFSSNKLEQKKEKDSEQDIKICGSKCAIKIQFAFINGFGMKITLIVNDDDDIASLTYGSDPKTTNSKLKKMKFKEMLRENNSNAK